MTQNELEAHQDVLPTILDLDDLVHLETMFEQIGREEGIMAGRNAGYLQGRLLGRERAFTIFQEVGYYHGVCMVLNALLEKQQSHSPLQNKVILRAQKQINQLIPLIDSFPRENRVVTNNEEDAATLLDRIRAKFKVVCSITGLKTGSGNRGAVILAPPDTKAWDKPVRLDY